VMYSETHALFFTLVALFWFIRFEEKSYRTGK
jgi:hypothetical protein